MRNELVPLQQIDRLDLLEDRRDASARRLQASLTELEDAVKASLPTQALKRQARADPLATVATAFLAGFALAALTRI